MNERGAVTDKTQTPRLCYRFPTRRGRICCRGVYLAGAARRNEQTVAVQTLIDRGCVLFLLPSRAFFSLSGIFALPALPSSIIS